MADLLRLRDALALRGQADARQLSAQLNLSAAMTQAMLEQLVMMGKAERLRVAAGADLPAGCRHCPQGGGCRTPVYRLTPRRD
ncbi:FeoC-like transcriptional regulator [Sodalis sp. C49]|uniref:FeoC-like transcriptional regulator n=1 Tax=unclassified Sodalis (in: enterobacteria) TaxID=2636512 RepID=UPI003965AACB